MPSAKIDHTAGYAIVMLAQQPLDRVGLEWLPVARNRVKSILLPEALLHIRVIADLAIIFPAQLIHRTLRPCKLGSQQFAHGRLAGPRWADENDVSAQIPSPATAANASDHELPILID